MDGRNSGPPGPGEAESPPSRMQLKRYTVTETVSRQSEFGPEERPEQDSNLRPTP